MNNTIFKVWCPEHWEQEEDAMEVIAGDESEAAKAWARVSDHDSGEYPIANGYYVLVMVRNTDSGEPFECCVEGRYEPFYMIDSIRKAGRED